MSSSLTSKITAIRRAWLPNSLLKAIATRQWEQAPEARPLDEFNTSFLYPACTTIERLSLPSKWATILGGTCQLYTGDLKNQTTAHRLAAAQQVRLDQLFIIGLVQGEKTVFSAEDSLFAALVGCDVELFTQQAHQMHHYLERLGKLVGVADVQMVLTSSIEAEITEHLQILAQEIGDAHFLEIHPAPVLLMYSYHWAEILFSKGYIPSTDVLRIEPIEHFQRTILFQEPRKQVAYMAFFDWVTQHAYAKSGTQHHNYGVVGRLPTYSSGVYKKPTRALTFDEVVNNRNWRVWSEKLHAHREEFPFPLNYGFVFGEAANYLIHNAEAIDLMYLLTCYEAEYNHLRKELYQSENPQLQAASLRKETMRKSSPIIVRLITLLDELLCHVFDKDV